MTQLKCWRCGTDLAELSLPLARLDECPNCVVHLHVCRMCKFYDPTVTKACREDDAEEVRDKQAANFCDYFKPTPKAFDPSMSAAADKARSQLDDLFGGVESGSAGPDAAAEDLFGNDPEK